MQIFKHIRSIAIAGAFALATTHSAFSATLDFTGVNGPQPSQLVLTEATINNLDGGSIFVNADGLAADGFCFTDLGFQSCTGNGEINFTNAIENLFFDVIGAETGDAVEILAFNNGIFVDALVAIENGTLDFSGFGVITSLSFNDNSTQSGVLFTTFNFDVVNVNAVPVPAALPLFGTGLAVMGFVGWRRKRKVTTTA